MSIRYAHPQPTNTLTRFTPTQPPSLTHPLSESYSRNNRLIKIQLQCVYHKLCAMIRSRNLPRASTAPFVSSSSSSLPSPAEIFWRCSSYRNRILSNGDKDSSCPCRTYVPYSISSQPTRKATLNFSAESCFPARSRPFQRLPVNPYSFLPSSVHLTCPSLCQPTPAATPGLVDVMRLRGNYLCSFMPFTPIDNWPSRGNRRDC